MRSLRHPILLLLGTLVVGPAFAEVGIALGDSESGPVTLYELKIIVDDSNPTWTRFNPDSPARKILNDQGEVNGDGRPFTLVHPDTNIPSVLWGKNNGNGSDIVVSTFQSGSWSTPTTVVVGIIVDDPEPIGVVDPADGSVHVFYWTEQPGPQVMHTQAPADLSSWTAPTQVSPAGEIALRPSAVFHQGVLKVAYECHNLGPGGTPRLIELATEDGVGDFTYETIATSHYEGGNHVEVHSGLDVLWVDWVDTETEIGWTRDSGSGSWEPIQTESYSNLEDKDFNARGRVKRQAID